MDIKNVFSGAISSVELDRIRLPRHILRGDMGSLNELMGSIALCGLLQPIVVRPVEDGFEVVTGNRRFEACRQLGWRCIPCSVMALDDREAFEVSLIENIQRKTLNPVEEARAFKMYVEDFGWGGITDLAKRIGKSSQYVSQRLQMLRLPDDILRRLDEGFITPSLLREIVGLDDAVQRSIVEMAVRRGLSSRRVGRIVKRFKSLDNAAELFPDIPLAASETDREFKFVDRLFSRCIDALKFSLLEFDDVINDVKDEWVIRDLLMVQRRSIHDQIDVLIRCRMRFKNLSDCFILPV